jgi:hypothetical protein
MSNAHLDASTTGHTLDTEFDLLGLLVERIAALNQGDALKRVVGYGRKRRFDGIKDSRKGSLEGFGDRHYSGRYASSTSGKESGQKTKGVKRRSGEEGARAVIAAGKG